MIGSWNRPHHVAHEMVGEPPHCFWMLAGVVDYKLCDRQYDCEHCPLDRALREGAAFSARPASEPTEPTPDQLHAEGKSHPAEFVKVRGYEWCGPRFYHPNHLWAGIEAEGQVRIGLDDFGQKLVGRIYFVHLPEPGARVSGEAASWRIVHQAGETALATPMTGTVLQRNEKLRQLPSMINYDPYGQGWVMVIEPARLAESLKALYYGQAARQWYERETERLHQELLELVKRLRPDVGATLQDGGTLGEDVLRTIDADQLQQVIAQFLSASVGHQFGSPD